MKKTYYDHSWNFFTGCTKCSDACEICSAEFNIKKLKNTTIKRISEVYRNGFEFTVHPDMLAIPDCPAGARIVVNNMSDTFHPEAPEDILVQQFYKMIEDESHTFIICTKRAERMKEFVNSHFLDALEYAHNIWLGVSVESEKYIKRIEMLRQTNCAVKCVFFEPITKVFDADLSGINGVFAGTPTIPGKDFILSIADLKKMRSAAHNIGAFFYLIRNTNYHEVEKEYRDTI